MKVRVFELFVIATFALLIFSCNEKEIVTNPPSALEFTTDTLTFDTVFTTLGTTTKIFKVKNPNAQTVQVSEIFLAGGQSSPFRLNINGTQTKSVADVQISAGDSLFIFVEATIDPTNQNNPMIFKDSVVFNLNGTARDVKLIAFGQDFHLLDGEVIETQHWTNDKPYLIYNSVLVDSLHTLTIDAGCRIHFHKESSLFIKGTLIVNGSFDAPVNFLGDRLEKEYENLPDQWGAFTVFDDGSVYSYGGLHFLVGSTDNTIDYAVIKNAKKGIQVDSLGTSANPVLTLKNTRIENMTLNCLDARTTTIKASNCVFANSGSYSVALRFGGDYEFYHCTVANYYSTGTRKEPALILNNFYTFDKKIYSFDFNAEFGNCIIYGNNSDEILSNFSGESDFAYQFTNCLLKTNPNSLPTEVFVRSVFNKEPNFTNISEYKYEIDSLSPARNMGDPEIASLFPLDLNNNSRLEDEGPDAGAQEWVPQEEE